MEPTPDAFQKIVNIIQSGGSAALAAISLFINWLLWNSLKEERAARALDAKERLADKDATADRMLKMADQNREVAIAANTTTITNTASLEASRLAIEKSTALNERVLVHLERMGGSK